MSKFLSRHIKTLITAGIFSAILTVSSFASTIGGGNVTATLLNLRSEAGTNSPIKTVIPQNGSVAVDGKINDSWYSVWYNGYSGYVFSEYLSFSKAYEADFGIGEVNATDVRMRATASYDGDIIGKYDYGATFNVTGIFGEWYRVDNNGSPGYIYSDFLTLKYSGTDADSVSDGQQIVDTAMKYLGISYVYGGTSASGFDCSGLVYYTYKECGYSTNRTAASLYQDGTAVSRDDLQPGDVICFATNGYIHHTGIYIGDGQFIHASSGAGKVVITDLSTSYYSSHYYGARRIV